MPGDGVQWIPGMRVVGIAARCVNDHPEGISALWKRFFDEDVPARVKGKGLFAVYFEYMDDYTEPYTLLIGSEVDEDATVPDGMREVILERGNYTVFDASGPRPASVVDAWSKVWHTPMTRSYRTDFEMYHGRDGATIYVGTWED